MNLKLRDTGVSVRTCACRRSQLGMTKRKPLTCITNTLEGRQDRVAESRRLMPPPPPKFRRTSASRESETRESDLQAVDKWLTAKSKADSHDESSVAKESSNGECEPMSPRTKLGSRCVSLDAANHDHVGRCAKEGTDGTNTSSAQI